MPQEPQPAKRVVKRVIKKTVVRRPVASQPDVQVRHGLPKAASKKTAAAMKATSQRGGTAASAVAGSLQRAAHAVSGTIADRYQSVRARHLPQLGQTIASALVGAIIGIVTVAITVLLLMLFSTLRGVATGGGTWGSLMVVVVAFIAFALGEYLLTKFRVRQPRVTSFLGLCLTLIAIMAVFIGPIYGLWAWLIVPALGAMTFALSHRVIAMADSAR